VAEHRADRRLVSAGVVVGGLVADRMEKMVSAEVAREQ
jgi:hypothetical protein